MSLIRALKEVHLYLCVLQEIEKMNKDGCPAVLPGAKQAQLAQIGLKKCNFSFYLFKILHLYHLVDGVTTGQ